MSLNIDIDNTRPLSYRYALAIVVYQFFRFGVNIWVARELGPEEYANWNIMQPILFYGMLLTLGMPNAINRQVPYLLGKKDIKKLRNSINTTTFSLFFLLSLFIFISESVSLYFSLDRTWQIFFVLLAIWQFYIYSQIFLKSTQRFDALSVQLLIFAFVQIITIAFFIKYGLKGYIISLGISSLISIVFNFKISDIFLKNIKIIHIEFTTLKPLLSIGLPIMLIGFLFYFLVTLDKLVIGYLFSKRELGFYTLAALTINIVIMITAIIDQQFYPRLCYQYGNSHSLSALRPILSKQLMLDFSLTLIAIIMGQIFIEPFVRHIMPKYIEGITSARILMLGLIPLSLCGAFGTFLNAIKKQIVYLTTQAIGVIITLILCVSSGIIFKKIEFVAAATSIGFLLYTIIISSIVIYFFYREKKKVCIKRSNCITS